MVKIKVKLREFNSRLVLKVKIKYLSFLPKLNVKDDGTQVQAFIFAEVIL